MFCLFIAVSFAHNYTGTVVTLLANVKHMHDDGSSEKQQAEPFQYNFGIHNTMINQTVNVTFCIGKALTRVLLWSVPEK